MRAKVVVEYIIENVCGTGELKGSGFDSFDEMVRYIIREEGLFGIIADHPEESIGAGGKILSIKEG